MGRTSSITMQSLGKIVQRAPAVGAKMWCLFFLFFCFFCHAPSPERRAFEGCIVRTRIALPFIGRFRRGLDHLFSEVIALSDTLHSSHVRRQVAPQFSRNCGQKLRKVQKSAEKFVRTTSYRQLRVLKKILLQQFSAETVDVQLYKFFSARRYIALIASVKFRIGGPKTARNVQVCAHQKSYRK